jgi:predicted Zn-dependent protease with MMP-like domain
MLRIGREEFEEVVADALDLVPEELARYLENVAVVVEDEPGEEDLLEAGVDPRTETLFGLFQGAALSDRGLPLSGELPERIVIYRLPLLELCEDRAELIREISDTVVHEIGHFFGLPEEDLP